MDNITEIQALNKTNEAILSTLASLKEKTFLHEQKLAGMADPTAGLLSAGYKDPAQGLASEMRKDAGFAAMLRGEQESFGKSFDLHGLYTKSVTVSSTDTAQAQRMPGAVAIDAPRDSWVRNLIPTAPCSAANIEFVKQVGTRADAGAQAGGSPLQREAVVKKESAFSFEAVSLPVVTLAHWTQTSRQLADDVSSLTAFIGGELIAGIDRALEIQILGDGTTPGDIAGLAASGNHTVYNLAATGDSPLDALRKSIAQCQLGNTQPDAIILNPLTFASLELTKATDGVFIAGTPRGTISVSLWGVPLIVTPAMAENEFVVAGLRQSTQLWIRSDSVLRVSDSHDQTFTSNVLTWLCEGRFGFGVTRPSGVIYGSF
jgi:HK97 family phage major capsid protein